MQCLHHAYLEALEEPSKNGGPTNYGRQQFSQEGFGHYTDQKTPFLKKVKTNGKALEDSI